jgi:hypothetical protein
VKAVYPVGEGEFAAAQGDGRGGVAEVRFGGWRVSFVSR